MDGWVLASIVMTGIAIVINGVATIIIGVAIIRILGKR